MNSGVSPLQYEDDFTWTFHAFLHKIKSPFVFLFGFTKFNVILHSSNIYFSNVFSFSLLQHKSHILSSKSVAIPKHLFHQKLNSNLWRFLERLNKLDISCDDHGESMLSTQWLHEVLVGGIWQVPHVPHRNRLTVHKLTKLIRVKIPEN